MVLTKRNSIFAAVLASAIMFAFAGAASALTTSCTGSPTATNITWTATSSGGVEPVAFLWGNGATSSTQTVAYGVGTQTITLQATDASSTVATSTCSATILQAAPTISLFTANPGSITLGQSSVLSWNVSNASSTSISGLGTVTGTSTSVTPAATTIYTLTATNPGGSTTANVTVTVASSTQSGGVISQIQALLNQINALKLQIAQLLAGQLPGGTNGGGTSTTTPAGCFTFWRDLKHGDVGDDVKELQKQLVKEDPKLFPPGLITGFFGPKTQAALKMWQRRWGVDSIGTGFFGMKSRAFFKSQCSDGDNDHDGITNAQDPDDDNDGIADLQDSNPFKSASSTDDRKDKKDKDNKGHGGGRDDDEDDD